MTLGKVVRVGLTGGIGSGKSTVARLLGQCGAAVIDADAISRELTAANGLAIAPLAAAFGADFIDAAGGLNRDRMRALVFAEPSARARLEQIIHPMVGLETERQALAACAQGTNCLVFDVPLLVESIHWRQRVDHVLVVDCLPETQIARVVSRSALTQQQVVAIMSQQASRAKRLQAADSVIFNDGLSLKELEDVIRALALCFGLSSMPSQVPAS